MKLLEAVELKPSRAAMERALDEMDWGSVLSDNDAFFAVFRAAFRRATILRLRHDLASPLNAES